jgi:hypothetical protein
MASGMAPNAGSVGLEGTWPITNDKSPLFWHVGSSFTQGEKDSAVRKREGGQNDAQDKVVERLEWSNSGFLELCCVGSNWSCPTCELISRGVDCTLLNWVYACKAAVTLFRFPACVGR